MPQCPKNYSSPQNLKNLLNLPFIKVILEKIISRQLTAAMTTKHFRYSQYQSSFHQRHSTETDRARVCNVIDVIWCLRAALDIAVTTSRMNGLLSDWKSPRSPGLCSLIFQTEVHASETAPVCLRALFWFLYWLFCKNYRTLFYIQIWHKCCFCSIIKLYCCLF